MNTHDDLPAGHAEPPAGSAGGAERQLGNAEETILVKGDTRSNPDGARPELSGDAVSEGPPSVTDVRSWVARSGLARTLNIDPAGHTNTEDPGALGEAFVDDAVAELQRLFPYDAERIRTRLYQTLAAERGSKVIYPDNEQRIVFELWNSGTRQQDPATTHHHKGGMGTTSRVLVAGEEKPLFAKAVSLPNGNGQRSVTDGNGDSVHLKQEYLARVAEEAAILQALHRLGVTPRYEGQARRGGRIVLLLEEVRGISLRQFMDMTHGNRSTEDSLYVALALADTLALIHDQGRVIWRDVKGTNIMLSDQPHYATGVVFVDTGLARFNTDESIALTAHSAMGGTPGYMAPEQANVGFHELTDRADVWALAIELYELFAGKPLPPSFGLKAIHANGIGPDSDLLKELVGLREQAFAELPDDLPDAVKDVLRKCLSFDAEGISAASRPSAAELAAVLIKELYGEDESLANYRKYPRQKKAFGSLKTQKPSFGRRLRRMVSPRVRRDDAVREVDQQEISAQLLAQAGPDKIIISQRQKLAALVGGGIVALSGLAYLASKPAIKEHDKGGENPAAASAVDTTSPVQILAEPKFSSYPGSDSVTWNVQDSVAGCFSNVQVGANDECTQIYFYHPDGDEVLKGNVGGLIGVLQKSGGKAVVTNFDVKNGGGYSYSGENGSATRSYIGDVGTFLRGMGVEALPKKMQSQVILRAFGRNQEWVLLVIEGEDVSALFAAGPSAQGPGAPKPILFKTPEDCRRYLESQGLLDAVLAPLDVVKGPGATERRKQPGFDELGRPTLNDENAELCRKQLQESLEAYLRSGQAAVTNRTARNP